MKTVNNEPSSLLGWLKHGADQLTDFARKMFQFAKRNNQLLSSSRKSTPA